LRQLRAVRCRPFLLVAGGVLACLVTFVFIWSTITTPQLPHRSKIPFASARLVQLDHFADKRDLEYLVTRCERSLRVSDELAFSALDFGFYLSYLCCWNTMEKRDIVHIVNPVVLKESALMRAVEASSPLCLQDTAPRTLNLSTTVLIDALDRVGSPKRLLELKNEPAFAFQILFRILKGEYPCSNGTLGKVVYITNI
jgi:hypothetical protein